MRRGSDGRCESVRLPKLSSVRYLAPSWCEGAMQEAPIVANLAASLPSIDPILTNLMASLPSIPKPIIDTANLLASVPALAAATSPFNLDTSLAFGLLVD